MDAAVAIGRRDAEVAVLAGNSLHPLVLAYVKPMMLSHFAVVLERFLPRGLLMRRGERHVSDLQQLRRSEEGHIRGIVVYRIHQAALIEYDHLESDFLSFDRAGETRGTRADHQHIGGY